MLRNVMQQLVFWHQAGHLIFASVNLSAKDAINRELPVFIEGLLSEYKISPEYLKLEFSERGCLSDKGYFDRGVKSVV